MDYVPWPEDGCTLGEARERTANRSLWREWRARIDGFNSEGPPASWLSGYSLEEVHWDAEVRRRQKSQIVDGEARIDSQFRDAMRHRKMTAVGRPGSLTAEPQVIDAEIWPALTSTNWSTSAVGENRRGGIAFHAVRVFPALLGPTRIDLLDGLTLAKAAKQFVVDDPEVAALGARAVAAKSSVEEMFKYGWWTPSAQREWPLSVNAASFDEEEAVIGFLGPPDPPYVVEARRALTDRVIAFLGPLRDDLIFAEGMPIRPRDPHRVPKAIWSHRDFAVDLEGGDVFQKNEQAESFRDLLVKCWSALTLCRPERADSANVATSRVTRRRSAIRREASQAAEDRCLEWLSSEMKASPDLRPRPKSAWREEALRTWPGLSGRAFDRLWDTAIRDTGARRWSEPGAPKKSSQQ